MARRDVDAARAGLGCFIFIPDDLEQGKIIGSAIYGPCTVVSGNDGYCAPIPDGPMPVGLCDPIGAAATNAAWYTQPYSCAASNMRA